MSRQAVSLFAGSLLPGTLPLFSSVAWGGTWHPEDSYSTRTVWRGFLLHRLDLSPPFFFLWSLPPTTASCLASYCPLPHQEHNCRLPCLCRVHTPQFGEAFLRHLQFLKLGYQLDLGACTGRKVDRTPSAETSPQLSSSKALREGKRLFPTLLPRGSKPLISSQIPGFRKNNQLTIELFASFHSIHSTSSQKRISLPSFLSLFFLVLMRTDVLSSQMWDKSNTNSKG